VLGNRAGGSDVRGGVSRLTGGLTGVELGSAGPSPGERRRREAAGRYVIEIHGGASKLTVDTDAA
jgi:hypothetical protein